MYQTRDGTGLDFFDPARKFQNLGRLTSSVNHFFTEGFCSLMHVMKNFPKGEAMGKVLKFVALDGDLRNKSILRPF